MYSINDLKDKLINGDALTELKLIPNETFNFAYIDPPYFMKVKDYKPVRPIGKMKEIAKKAYSMNIDWDKFQSDGDYIKFTKDYLTEIKRVLKSSGSVMISIGFQWFDVVSVLMKELDFEILNYITWYKPNGMPNYADTRHLNNRCEYMIWASKSKGNHYTYNYKTAKEMNNQEQLETLWQVNYALGKERLQKEKDDGKSKYLHPTQKPEKLLHIIIDSFTNINDMVIDPFGETFTTAAMCKQTGRHYCSIEIDKQYFKQGKERVDKVETILTDLEKGILDHEEIKLDHQITGQQFLF